MLAIKDFINNILLMKVIIHTYKRKFRLLKIFFIVFYKLQVVVPDPKFAHNLMHGDRAGASSAKDLLNGYCIYLHWTAEAKFISHLK